MSILTDIASLKDQQVLILSDQKNTLSEKIAKTLSQSNLIICDKPETILNQEKQRYTISLVLSSHTNIHAWHSSIGLLKNLYSEHIIFLCPNTQTDIELGNALRTLAFRIEETEKIDNTSYFCASYNLVHYNKKRDWNNARFWANPENFGKYRW